MKKLESMKDSRFILSDEEQKSLKGGSPGVQATGHLYNTDVPEENCYNSDWKQTDICIVLL
ncbi:MAG: hypothetical protein AAF620_08135 [Bacteroidota bacterium]